MNSSRTEPTSQPERVDLPSKHENKFRGDCSKCNNQKAALTTIMIQRNKAMQDKSVSIEGYVDTTRRLRQAVARKENIEKDLRENGVN